jgi:hypothetical protein
MGNLIRKDTNKDGEQSIFPPNAALEQNAERLRLAEAHENMKPWYLWGPYLTERQWGTVRED